MTSRVDLEYQVQTLTPKAAKDLLDQNPRAMLIDVRSSMEHLFVGHPQGAIHVSWIDEPDWKVNPHFAQEIRKLMLGGVTSHDDGVAPVLLICRSGHRSLEAGACLLADGFTQVYNIEGGFEGPLNEAHHRSSVAGWRHEGLPWEQC
jgi:rhodanese-related sulfurtransferase